MHHFHVFAMMEILYICDPPFLHHPVALIYRRSDTFQLMVFMQNCLQTLKSYRSHLVLLPSNPTISTLIPTETVQCNTRRIRPYLTEYATQLLEQALVTSHPDYCNALLEGLHACIKPEPAAHLVFNQQKMAHSALHDSQLVPCCSLCITDLSGVQEQVCSPCSAHQIWSIA